jgi:hypothetical protein
VRVNVFAAVQAHKERCGSLYGDWQDMQSAVVQLLLSTPVAAELQSVLTHHQQAATAAVAAL